MFSSPVRSPSSPSSFRQISPTYPASPHPELIASPNSRNDVVDRVAARSRSWSRSSSSLTPSSSPFRRGLFTRPESSLYYTASVKSSLGSGIPPARHQQGDVDDIFGGELNSPANPTATAAAHRFRLEQQAQISSSTGVGVLSALLASTRRSDTLSGLAESQYLQRRYTEDWIRRYQQANSEPNPSWHITNSEGDLDVFPEDEEDRGDTEDPTRRHRRNLSATKTITPADFEGIFKKISPEPAGAGRAASTVDSSDNETGYLYYKTAPQSMAGMSGPPPVPEKDYKVENEINRPPSSSSTVLNGNGSSSTPTITQASLAPAKPPTRVTSPNPRALVKWGKRTVVVCVPADVRDESGEDIVYRRPPVMSKEEVMEKMKRWESLGYGLEIFDSNGQSRAIYPEEIHGRVGKSEIIVNIPDREGEQISTFYFDLYPHIIRCTQWMQCDSRVPAWGPGHFHTVLGLTNLLAPTLGVWNGVLSGPVLDESSSPSS